MLIKALIISVALMTHMWLWGHWSLEKSIGQTGMIVGASVLLALIIILPVNSLIKKKSLFTPFSKFWFKGIIYLYILLILFLGAVSFTGLIQYLLPIKILLIGVYAFLKYKISSRKPKQIKTSEFQ